MTKLIINADDFGYSKGVNLGIIEAFQNGVVTSATLMANMPGAEHAAALAKENLGLGVGIHFVLTCGKPICRDVPSLINDHGEFHRFADLEKIARIEEIERELTSQFESFLSFGIQPTHIDSHHHVHAHKDIYPIVEDIAKKNKLPIRKVGLESNPLQPVEFFSHKFYGDDLTEEFLSELLNQIVNYESAELMTHPAYIDEALLTGSSYTLQRVRELSLLTSHSVRRKIKALGIELINYRDLYVESFVK